MVWIVKIIYCKELNFLSFKKVIVSSKYYLLFEITVNSNLIMLFIKL